MARQVNGHLGTFATIAELTTKLPPSESIGCSANVGTAIPYTKAWCDGNEWALVPASRLQTFATNLSVPRVLYVKNTASSKADDNTTEADLASFVIPANTLGPNDSIRITHLWQYPNSATTKNIKIVIGAAQILSFGVTTTQKFQGMEIGRCRGSTSAQIWANDQLPFQARAAAALVTSIDFTIDNTLRVVGSWGTAGTGSNLLTLESVLVETLPAPYA